MQFRGGTGGPVVDSGTAGEPQATMRRGAEQRLAERAVGGAERDGLRAREPAKPLISLVTPTGIEPVFQP